MSCYKMCIKAVAFKCSSDAEVFFFTVCLGSRCFCMNGRHSASVGTDLYLDICGLCIDVIIVWDCRLIVMNEVGGDVE
jgi:hypothetical protein